MSILCETDMSESSARHMSLSEARVERVFETVFCIFHALPFACNVGFSDDCVHLCPQQHPFFDVGVCLYCLHRRLDSDEEVQFSHLLCISLHTQSERNVGVYETYRDTTQTRWVKSN